MMKPLFSKKAHPAHCGAICRVEGIMTHAGNQRGLFTPINVGLTPLPNLEVC
jgi:hypothetical protein